MDSCVYRVQGKAKVVTPRLRDVVVALGSNQGDRQKHLTCAVASLHTHIKRIRLSSFIETAAEGVGPQPDFLNGVLVGVTALSPEKVMNVLLDIEHKHGRVRPYVGAPRTLDLDLILMGSCVFKNEYVQVPHPRFRQRRFVLKPLIDLAPELVDPVTGSTMAELFAALPPFVR